jgi:hypothetical protein
MIFDDHDVTDDWNIDSYFEEDTRRGNPTGSRIVANAIAAYWAFQGWGNDPDDRRYDTNYIRTVQDHVDGMIATNGLSDSRAAGEASGAFARQFLQQRNFGFVAPTEPKALFIDTRTQRKHARGARAPVLLPHDALMAIAHTLDRQFKWGGDLIAVLPCPVMPASVALGGHQWKLRGGTRELAIEWDAEQFWNHPDGPFGLIHMIATWCNPAHCFIFSGDVHHGYVIRAVFKNFDDPKRYRDYYQRGGFLWAMTGASFPAIDKELAIPADITLTAIQITSSPIKNYQDAFESGSSRQIEKMGFNSDPNSSSVYSLGEHLIGARRMVFACRYKAVGGYLQFQVETDVVDKKGTRPYSAMDRAIGAPHFCIFHRADPADGNLSRAVVEFIGLRRPKRGDDDYWSSQCVVDLKEFSPRS